MSEKKYIFRLIGILLIILLVSSTSTFAYLQWVSSDEDKTLVTFTVTKNFECAADGGGNITQNEVKLKPATCTNATHAIKREVKVMPTLYTNDSGVIMDLWLNVDNLTDGLKNSDNFKYALTTSSTSCETGVISTGNFKNKVQDDQVNILTKTYAQTKTDTYYLWIWLDKEESDPATMNQEFQLSIGGQCQNYIEEPLVGEAYAVYSADDNSFRFYRSETPITAGSTYRGRTATSVYTGFETAEYSPDNLPPWINEHSEDITSVYIEDKIKPISISTWFGLKNVSNVDVTNINVSKVTNMSATFLQFGYESSIVNIVGMDNWDTSNVTTMMGMFGNTGIKATSFDIGDISRWNVSKVTDMTIMFFGTAPSATFHLDLSGWDVSNVMNVNEMCEPNKVFDGLILPSGVQCTVPQ